MVGHAGARLLTDVADDGGVDRGVQRSSVGVTAAAGRSRSGAGRGGLAVTIADGGEAIGDWRSAGPGRLFGAVASDATAWRVLSGLDSEALASLRMARARAREVAWAQMAETRDGIPAATAAGQPIDGLGPGPGRLDRDLPLGEGIGHPYLEEDLRLPPAVLLPGQHRRGSVGAAARGPGGIEHHRRPHHRLDSALEQIPDAHRYGTEILIRCDSAGCTRASWPTSAACASTASTPSSLSVWLSPNRSATRPEPLPTGSRPPTPTASCVKGRKSARSRVWYRRRRLPRRHPVHRAPRTPHPGAQLSLFDTIEGFRHQVTATDTPPGSGGIQFLEARHRAHARVKDRIRTGKHTGFGRFPSRIFAINAAWLELALTGIDLIAWTQTPATRRRPRQSRTKEAAVPTAARPGTDHPLGTTHEATPRRRLALGRTTGHRVHPPRGTATAGHLNTTIPIPTDSFWRNPTPRRATTMP